MPICIALIGALGVALAGAANTSRRMSPTGGTASLQVVSGSNLITKGSVTDPASAASQPQRAG
jgi:hypothetical protein